MSQSNVLEGDDKGGKSQALHAMLAAWVDQLDEEDLNAVMRGEDPWSSQPIAGNPWPLSRRSRPEPSEFFPKLAFISAGGWSTANLTLSFFLSNPGRDFSREEVFAHLNRHCEEQGLGAFFAMTGYEMRVPEEKVEGALESELLQISKGFVLREINNLVKRNYLKRSSRDNKRSKYTLQDNERTQQFQDIVWNWPNSHEMLMDYSEFLEYVEERRNLLPTIQAVDSFEQLVDDWVTDVIEWVPENRGVFRTRLSRLSYYCETTQGESFSSRNREWFETTRHSVKKIGKTALVDAIYTHLRSAASRKNKDERVTKKSLGEKIKEELEVVLIEKIMASRNTWV